MKRPIKRKSWLWQYPGRRDYQFETKTVTKGIFKKQKVTKEVPVYHKHRDSDGYKRQKYTLVTVQEFYEETIQPFLETVEVVSINEYYRHYETVITVYYRDE